MVECKVCHKKVKGKADQAARKHRFGCPTPKQQVETKEEAASGADDDDDAAAMDCEAAEGATADAALLLSLTCTEVVEKKEEKGEHSSSSSSSSVLDGQIAPLMAVIRRDGCASFAALLSDMTAMLPEAAACYDRLLRRLKLTPEGKQMLPRANRERWAATFDPNVAFDTSVPAHRRHSFARLLIRLFTPSLTSAIAVYLGCRPEFITLDALQAIVYHGKTEDQEVHVDHTLGPNISVVLIFSLTASNITTRFAKCSHTSPYTMWLPPDFASNCLALPSTPFVIMDAAIFHYGVGGGADPKRFYGTDRVFITLSRPLTHHQRRLHSASSTCLLHRPTLSSLLA
jgi:hypothetical protein